MAYAKQFKERKVNTILSQVQCSSTMLNAVVNAKFNDAQSKGIDTSLRLVVQIPHDLEFDLSIMLSNLLDNAIEACEKSIKRTDTSDNFRRGRLLSDCGQKYNCRICFEKESGIENGKSK